MLSPHNPKNAFVAFKFWFSDSLPSLWIQMSYLKRNLVDLMNPSKIVLVSHIWVNLNGFLRAYNCLPIFPGPGNATSQRTHKKTQRALPVPSVAPLIHRQIFSLTRPFSLTTETWGTLTKPDTMWQLVFVGRNEKQAITNWLHIRTKVGFSHSFKMCCKDWTGQLTKWE